MNEKLWTLVQEFAGKAQVGNGELAAAGAGLDPEISSIFAKHMSNIGLQTNGGGQAEWV